MATKAVTMQNARKAGHLNLAGVECRDNDAGVSDITGDNCASWYNTHPNTCFEDLFRDEDFYAGDLCCSCGGGVWTDVDDGHANCDNKNFGATDTTGDDCSWYDNYPGTCGSYDTADFHANEMCCACSGGA
jgi:hypothetical protein